MTDKPGPTGEFPRGKISGDDDGEINIEFSHSDELGLVRMKFATPTRWIAFSPAEGLEMVRLILAHGSSLSDDPDRALRRMVMELIFALNGAGTPDEMPPVEPSTD